MNNAEVFSITMNLRAVYLSLHRQTNLCLLKHGVTADQFVCLVLLSKQDGITQQELARLALSDPNTIRAMLVLLEKRGYVAREKHPTDGRARRVTLTRLGRKIFQDLLATIEPLHDRLYEHLSETAVRGLNDSLRQVHEAMTTKPMNIK